MRASPVRAESTWRTYTPQYRRIPGTGIRPFVPSTTSTYTPRSESTARGSGFPTLTREACLADMHVVKPDGKPVTRYIAYRNLAWAMPVTWPVLPLLYLPGARAIAYSPCSSFVSRVPREEPGSDKVHVKYPSPKGGVGVLDARIARDSGGESESVEAAKDGD